MSKAGVVWPRYGPPSEITTQVSGTGNGSFVTGAPEFRIVSITSDVPCRLRMYRSITDRTADQARPHTVAPEVQGVVLAEFRWQEPATYWATGYVASLGESGVVYYRVDGGPASLDIKWIGVN